MQRFSTKLEPLFHNGPQNAFIFVDTQKSGSPKFWVGFNIIAFLCDDFWQIKSHFSIFS